MKQSAFYHRHFEALRRMKQSNLPFLSSVDFFLSLCLFPLLSSVDGRRLTSPTFLCGYVLKNIPSEALEQLIMLYSFQSFQIHNSALRGKKNQAKRSFPSFPLCLLQHSYVPLCLCGKKNQAKRSFPYTSFPFNSCIII